SRAKVLGGAAGDVTTENASFETVLLAAGSVDMNGGSVGELKLAAGKIDLNITVTDDGTVAGGEVRLGENMSVRGDMNVKAGTADLRGSYGGDVKIDAETVKIAGNYGGDLRINATRINIEPGTRIGGDLIAPNLTELREGVIVGGETAINKSTKKGKTVSISVDSDNDREAARAERRAKQEEAKAKSEATRAERRAQMDEAKAKVDEAKAKMDEVLNDMDLDASTKEAIDKAISRNISSAINRKISEHESDTDSDNSHDGDTGLISPEPMGMQAWLTVLVTLAACGALALGFAPQFLVQATERLAKEPLPSFGIGAASMIAVPGILVAVSITIIGIPFAILGAAAYMIGIGLGLIALCLWGGLMVRTLANQPGQETRLAKLVGWTLMGFLALALIGAVPFVGRAIQVIAIITGAGAVISTAWALRTAKKAQGPAAAI
ncbi:MAG: hypothetical protein JNM81_11600, partial [Rhodospirillaceae bacterium]|nr:hypothetical protein [Rhodospirillaceae bacterium]